MNTEVIASLTTAGGTLVLAVATFISTRSANRASRVAERALLAGLRPLLVAARLDSPRQKVGFSDHHWISLEGAAAAVEATDDVVYMAASIRNVGSGIAVLQGWYPMVGWVLSDRDHVPVEDFRRLTRDIFIAPGDLGFWQGALRDHDDPLFAEFHRAGRDREPVTIEVLYTDVHGGQRTISRLSLQPGSEGRWMTIDGRHWILDGQSAR
jgi:hypothetical protein